MLKKSMMIPRTQCGEVPLLSQSWPEKFFHAFSRSNPKPRPSTFIQFFIFRSICRKFGGSLSRNSSLHRSCMTLKIAALKDDVDDFRVSGETIRVAALAKRHISISTFFFLR